MYASGGFEFMHYRTLLTTVFTVNGHCGFFRYAEDEKFEVR